MARRHKMFFITVALVIFLSLMPLVGKSLYSHHQRKRIEKAKNFISDFQQSIPVLRPLEKYNMPEGIAKCGWDERGFAYFYECRVSKRYALRINKNIVAQLHSELVQDGWLIATRYFLYQKDECHVSFSYHQDNNKIEEVLADDILNRVQILNKEGMPIGQFDLDNLAKTEISDIDVSLRCNWGILFNKTY